MTHDGSQSISTHSVEALGVGTVSAAAPIFFGPPEAIHSGAQYLTFTRGFGFQSGAPRVVTQMPVMSEAELEAEFASLADDTLEWAELTAGAVSESWPDA